MAASRRFSRDDETVALEATDHALVEAVFAQDAVGVAIFDRELHYLRVNATLAEINGVAPEDHVGRHVTAVLPSLGAELATTLARVVETGQVRDVVLAHAERAT
jgi:PAS domain-containing protein